MAKRYGSFTPARRAALRRAQLASAAKRRGRRRKVVRNTAIGVAAVGAGAIAGRSLHGYNQARVYNKYGNPEGFSSYPIGYHLKLQHNKRVSARKSLSRSVGSALKNQPVRTSVTGAGIKNPYVHKIDAASISKKKRIKVAYRNYKASVRAY